MDACYWKTRLQLAGVDNPGPGCAVETIVYGIDEVRHGRRVGSSDCATILIVFEDWPDIGATSVRASPALSFERQQTAALWREVLSTAPPARDGVLRGRIVQRVVGIEDLEFLSLPTGWKHLSIELIRGTCRPCRPSENDVLGRRSATARRTRLLEVESIDNGLVKSMAHDTEAVKVTDCHYRTPFL